MKTYRKIAKFNQNCTVCYTPILRGECLSIMLGTPNASHKRCEPDLIAHEVERRERAAAARGVK